MQNTASERNKLLAEPPIDLKRYGGLLQKILPMVIETEREYERLMAEATKLMDRTGQLPPEEIKLLGLLAGLLQDYEQKKFRLGASATPHSMLLNLMEARSLTHKDVWRLFGSKGIASEVLNGKRGISKTHARRLAEFFHVPAALFL